MLTAGLAVLPLAPVTNVEAERVPGVLMAISERFVREANTDHAATLWAATKVLLGLRYPNEQVEEFTRGVSAMILGIRGIEESSVYQDIFAKGEAVGRVEGRVEEARLAILRLGGRKLGQPDDGVRAAIEAIDNVDQLNSLLDRILDVSTWVELLTGPSGITGVTAAVSNEKSWKLTE